MQSSPTPYINKSIIGGSTTALYYNSPQHIILDTVKEFSRSILLNDRSLLTTYQSINSIDNIYVVVINAGMENENYKIRFKFNTEKAAQDFKKFVHYCLDWKEHIEIDANNADLSSSELEAFLDFIANILRLSPKEIKLFNTGTPELPTYIPMFEALVETAKKRAAQPRDTVSATPPAVSAAPASDALTATGAETLPTSPHGLFTSLSPREISKIDELRRIIQNKCPGTVIAPTPFKFTVNPINSEFKRTLVLEFENPAARQVFADYINPKLQAQEGVTLQVPREGSSTISLGHHAATKIIEIFMEKETVETEKFYQDLIAENPILPPIMPMVIPLLDSSIPTPM